MPKLEIGIVGDITDLKHEDYRGKRVYVSVKDDSLNLPLVGCITASCDGGNFEDCRISIMDAGPAGESSADWVSQVTADGLWLANLVWVVWRVGDGLAGSLPKLNAKVQR